MRLSPLACCLALAAGSLFAQMPEADAPKAITPQVDQDGRPFHLVVEGDTILSIAATYHLKVQRLVDINKVKNNMITVGQKVYLAPAGAKVELPARDPKESQSVPQIDEKGRAFHVVQAGDNPWTICGLYGVDLFEFIDLNKVKNYTVTPGQKVYLPIKGPKAGDASREAGAAQVPAGEDAVVRNGREGDRRALANEVLGAGRPAALRAAAKAQEPQPAFIPVQLKGIFPNPEAGKTQPTNPRLARPLIQTPGPILSLAEVMTPLPLIDNGSYRNAWTKSQENIATWWEKAPVHTVGILTSCRWSSDQSGATLILTITPSAHVSSSVQVTIPGPYLPVEIDTNQIRRWAGARTPIEVVGHLNYLDGPEPVGAIRAGALLSPWELVAQIARVHVPAGPWTPITVPPGSQLPQKQDEPVKVVTPLAPSPSPASPAAPAQGKEPQKPAEPAKAGAPEGPSPTVEAPKAPAPGQEAQKAEKEAPASVK